MFLAEFSQVTMVTEATARLVNYLFLKNATMLLSPSGIVIAAHAGLFIYTL